MINRRKRAKRTSFEKWQREHGRRMVADFFFMRVQMPMSRFKKEVERVIIEQQIAAAADGFAGKRYRASIDTGVRICAAYASALIFHVEKKS